MYRKLIYLSALLLSITIRFRKNSKFTEFVVKNATQKLTATEKKFAGHNIRVPTGNSNIPVCLQKKRKLPQISSLSFFKKLTFGRPDF